MNADLTQPLVATAVATLNTTAQPVAANSVPVEAIGTRIHYLDNLRALAMLLGVVLHAGLAYAIPAKEVWLATDNQGSLLIDIGIWFIHLFRMSLFFLLSGYFGALLVERRGIKKFLWNRLIRVAVPMVLFFPFLVAAMYLVIVLALEMDYEKRGLMGLIERAVRADGAAPAASRDQQALGWMHLWFLYYLLMFSLIAAAIAGRTRISWHWLFERRWLLVLSPLALGPGIALGGIPVPPAEAFVPELWPFAFYGLFYWVGWQLFGREKLLQALQAYLWPLVLGSLALFIPYYCCLPVLNIEAAIRRATDLSPIALVIEVLLTAYLSVSLTLVSLLLGQRYLANHSPSMRLIADASYWVYLVHLPVVLLLQTLLVPLAWNVWIKFAVTTVGTFAACMVTYLVCVRYTPVGWLLNGKRTFP